MCGITGYYQFEDHISQQDLRKATSALSHRGPDAEDFYFSGNVGLGHRRLSIIDISEAANQPIYSHDGNSVIVYNGEIYNYKEIAVKTGSEYYTHSDTEVILESYTLWDNRCVDFFNGMFAIAIFNTERNKITLFRDRIGIKPLYYFWDGKVFAFASEIKALLCINYVVENSSINYLAISEFLHYGFIGDINTFYKNIYQVKAGGILTIGREGIKEESFWNLNGCIKERLISDEKEAKEQLNELICSSVRYRLICDVPFGSFLSGGVDSSLITAIASKNYEGRLKTFSIGFKDSFFDESPYSREVAKILGTEHHEFMVTENDALEWVNDSIEIFDQPFEDSSAIPSLLVSKMAAGEVKMVLTGDGGDELFFGYGAYKWANRFNNPILYFLRKPAAMAMQFGSSRYQRVAELLNYRQDDNLRSHIFSQEQYLFSIKELEQLIMPEICDTNENAYLKMNYDRTLTPEESQALFDISYYLKDDLLVKVDRTSMFHSLECRVPLLDYRIVEWSLNLDPGLKYKNGCSKYLLKKILFEYLPEALFARPKKGFSVPMTRWLKGPLNYLIEEYLSEESVSASNILNFEEVSRLKKRFMSGRSDYLYNRIWALIVLQKMTKKKFIH
ncbi:MAG: asparagine synthase (glutamine-hydrolyzing) [Bacteroidetes bacterium]|nr:asparagine synthase (glutamine-hydrolyzing) [Bacteroidota bacterium]